MNCDVVKDLIPLYIDGCCSEDSKIIVEQHIKDCEDCRKLFDDMKVPYEIDTVNETPKTFSKLNDWKASVLQSVLLFISFGLITVGVALEAGSPSGLLNGYWAFNMVIPATGFMLSLANWYFVRVYKNRKIFSNFSLLATVIITFCAFIWSVNHYECNNIFELFAENDLTEALEILHAILLLNRNGIVLTITCCALSKILSNKYAKMLGKE